MVKAFLFMKVTGRNYEDMHRDLRQRPVLVDAFGFARAPHRSAYSRTWRNRFGSDLQRFIEKAAEVIKQEAQNSGVPESRLAPPAEPQDRTNDDSNQHFSDGQINQTIRLARQHGLRSFDSGRAENATYSDTCFWELLGFLCMAACGTPQGARRFATHSNRQQTPHGDTLLRTVKQFDEQEILDDFHGAATALVDALKQTSALREPVNVAIDITEKPFWGESMDRTCGSKTDEYPAVHKFATLTVVGVNAPLVLAVTPVVPQDSRSERIEKPKHQLVAELMVKAQDIVDVNKVFCDREFDAMGVHKVIDNLGCTYLIPRREFGPEKNALDKIHEHPARVAVEDVALQTGTKTQEMTFMYVPSKRGEGHTVFATNRDVSPDRAQGLCAQYRRRWQIENEYKSLKHEFEPRTASREFPVRLFYFVFQCLLYNIWRVTDCLLKLRVDREIDAKPLLTAGELLEVVTSFLRPGG